MTQRLVIKCHCGARLKWRYDPSWPRQQQEATRLTEAFFKSHEGHGGIGINGPASSYL